LLIPISSAAEDKVTARDGTLAAYNNGVVKDTKTGLEWVAGPDTDMTWDEAKSWAESLTIDGGGWHLPTSKELQTLYQYGKGTSNTNPLFKTTGQYMWTGEKKDSSSFWDFNFSTGNDYCWHDRDISKDQRGLAVRPKR
jgi:hypothetical protein